MINVDCYNCGGKRKEFWAEENGYTMVKCRDCGLVYVDPRPAQEEIDQAIVLGVHGGTARVVNKPEFSTRRFLAYPKILKHLFGKELKGRRLSWLDIGCGNGELLLALRKHYPEIRSRGLEPTLSKRELAASLNLDVDYFELRDHPERYDIISALNVYSHLPDPPEFFRVCRNLLKPGGEILMETGDIGEWTRKDISWSLTLPDHLSFAPESVVRNILGKCGFNIVAVCKYTRWPCDHIAVRLAKEFLKLVWPGKNSEIGRYREFWREYLLSRRFIIDMYIRAKLA